jgi:hypothetical protein
MESKMKSIMNELFEIKKEFKTIGMLQEAMKFESMADGICSFWCTDGDISHQLLIKTDDTLLKEMTVEEILNLKRINFLEHTVFSEEFNGMTKVLGSKTYKPCLN